MNHLLVSMGVFEVRVNEGGDATQVLSSPLGPIASRSLIDSELIITDSIISNQVRQMRCLIISY